MTAAVVVAAALLAVIAATVVVAHAVNDRAVADPMPTVTPGFRKAP